jgi:dihydrolipoamide dehydrogenase
MKEYDVVVIGAGPGGYVSAIRASQNGLKTAIVEKEWMGGVCLNVGCIPSKALLKNADLAHTLRERSADFGITFDNLNLDYSAAVKRSRQVSDRLTKGVSFLMKKNNIDVFMGNAKLASKSQVDITSSEGNTESLQAKHIVIATGARVFTPPTWKVDGEKIITYREAILQESLPKSVVIIGAGAIGVEFATIWNSYGTQVTLVEMLPQVLPLADEEAAKELAKSFKKRGIEILTGHKVESVEATSQGVKVKVSGDDGEKELVADQALAAIGFRANSAELGLEDAGVKLDAKGNIEVDDRMATNVDGIWAIGDVTGKLLLAHIASKQGVICADAMAGKDTQGIDYQMAPSATYSQPQVAWFGMTEKQAQEAGYEVKVGKFPFSANGKALGLGESTGFAKIISDAQYGEILGAHMVGPEVSELLPELTLAQRMEMTAHEIAGNIHSHPTLSEVLMEAAEGIEGQYLQI